MVRLTQTGYVKPHETATTLDVTGPWTSGNEGDAEIHLAIYDGDTGFLSQAWFRVGELLHAIAMSEKSNA